MITVYYNNIKHKIDSSWQIQWENLSRANDKPTIIWGDGTLYWIKNGFLHRDGDKPARIWSDGMQEWYKNGCVHRDGNKPAKIWPKDTHICFYKHGKYYENFILKNLFYLQIMVKLSFYFKRNKFLWSPNNLAGKFTKKQLYKLITIN